MSDPHPLDNIIWASLVSHHARLAEGADVGAGTARRYPADVNLFYGVERCDDRGWSDLHVLAGDGANLVLFRDEIGELPTGWTDVFHGPGYQMVLERLADTRPADIRPLSADDVPAMLALTEATKPGPFFARTNSMGDYFGVFDDGVLVAMAGERCRAAGWSEISAVCTAESARGRGLASTLTAHVARHIEARGEQPMLHVAGNNDTARHVYERLGFVTRRMTIFAMLCTPA